MSNITVGSYLSKVLYLGIKISNLFFLLVITKKEDKNRRGAGGAR